MRPLLVLAAASLATLGCTTKDTAKPDSTTPATATLASAADPAAVRQTIDSNNARFSAAMVKGDTSVISSLYADDAVMLGANEKAVRGRAEIAKSFAGMHTAMKIPAFEIKAQDVVVSGDHAIETGTYTMTAQPKGAKAMNDVGKYLVVWKHQPDGSWKIIRDIYNSDLPAKP